MRRLLFLLLIMGISILDGNAKYCMDYSARVRQNNHLTSLNYKFEASPIPHISFGLMEGNNSNFNFIPAYRRRNQSNNYSVASFQKLHLNAIDINRPFLLKNDILFLSILRI